MGRQSKPHDHLILRDLAPAAITPLACEYAVIERFHLEVGLLFVYTVKAGETLATIAQAWGISATKLQEWNETEGQALTPGINLLLPGPPATLVHHTVGAGDTLTILAQRYGIPERAVAAANGLAVTATLEIGQILFVPMLIRKKRLAEVNGYLIPSGTVADEEIVSESEPMTFATVFNYHVNETGGIVPLPASQALAAMQQLAVDPLLCVTNFDGTNFNSDLAHQILASADLRAAVIASARATLAKEGYRGLNIDFEHMHPADRPLYNAFIKELRDAMHQDGYSLSIAMGPKTSDDPTASWMGAFDYATLGAAVDFLMLMTYEWGWVGGPPMAVAPIDQVRAVLQYATSVIPAEKILMGIPTYGYNWTLPDNPNNLASGISPKRAQNLAIEKGVTVRFHPMSASPMFHYYAGRVEHEVWYEDAKSLMAKFHLVYEMGLRGVSFWVLGQPFPQLWRLVADTFAVKKV